MQYNWDSTSDVRAILRTWAARFNRATLAFWDMSYRTNADLGAGNPGNLYIGSTLRGYVRVLQNFSALIPKSHTVTSPTVAAGSIRAYGLSWAQGYAVFVHAYTDHTNPTTGAQITLTVPVVGRAVWWNLFTGAELDAVAVTTGSQTLTVPDFTTACALIIT